jgi:hypothetical protein
MQPRTLVSYSLSYKADALLASRLNIRRIIVAFMMSGRVTGVNCAIVSIGSVFTIERMFAVAGSLSKT